MPWQCFSEAFGRSSTGFLAAKHGFNKGGSCRNYTLFKKLCTTKKNAKINFLIFARGLLFCVYLTQSSSCTAFG